MEEDKKTKGGIPARLGDRFHADIERIKTQRIIIGTSKERISTEKITNVIVRHKEAWKKITEDIISLPEEELKELWN